MWGSCCAGCKPGRPLVPLPASWGWRARRWLATGRGRWARAGRRGGCRLGGGWRRGGGGPGDEAQVDFGAAGKRRDPGSGEFKKAWVFVMTLSFSRHQYATLVFDQSVKSWRRWPREAFEPFGGVPRRIVIDNLKAA